MGDDIDNEFQQIAREYEPYYEAYYYRPASVTRIANNIYYESPIQRYFNELCSMEITAEQSEEIQKILKREKREEEKKKAIKEFYELTRVLEKVIDKG